MYRSEFTEWSQHWNKENQDNLSQRFFSYYRKIVFARTVGYFINRYFPETGIFAEAGSGTSETSIRINKKAGNRILIALDLILPVLLKNHPVMDIKLCGDIFYLPFQNESLDGLWNVGVMEHFLHPQIDQMMSEFHRVLKHGAPIVLLWPATNSIPQKLLRKAEKIIHRLNKDRAEFRFHPPEISQLHSIAEGREVLLRNHFKILEIDGGLKSLMAFITIAGLKA
jgi:SAM-dependent methyltransferase